MATQQINGTVTRKSNGSIEFTPSDAGTFNGLPAMGDEVSLTVEVTRTAREIEQATAAAKRERLASGEAQSGDPQLDGRTIVSAPVAERRVKK